MARIEFIVEDRQRYWRYILIKNINDKQTKEHNENN